MTVRRKGSCDPCCGDWKEKIKFLYENYREVVKNIEVNGLRTYYPDGNGQVDIETWPEVIDRQEYYTLICVLNAYQSDLIDFGTYWLLIAEKLESQTDYYNLSDSITLSITDDTNDWIIETIY